MNPEEKVTPPVKSDIPAWLAELFDVLEAIWNTLPASTQPHHPVAQKLAALKAKIPQ